ncbi:hypothetical protein [Phenylobacterium sp.]|uniref:hypothetical protein n=1 Tax=Phenylobacterium sp. TaxID=1871053 RepID=UPI002600A00D|nr:hypothetical protein [Phenylobacterium sp.]
MPRIAVPGLIDALIVKDAATIRTLATDPRLDRQYVPRGALINRILLGRLGRVLQLGGRRLPPVAEHGPVRPAPEQAALAARLNAIAEGGIKGADFQPLVDYVRGKGPEGDAGRLSQQAVGRLFSPAYQASADSWADAEVLGAAPSNFNPFKALIWALTGRVENARAALAVKVGGDPSGLHGTGVAIHNLSEAFARMRKIYAETRGHPSVSAEKAVGNALFAPRQVLRQPTMAMTLPAGQLSPDTLVILQLQAANADNPGYDMVFMEGAWAQCPAHRWIPALMSAVWLQATAEQA